MSADFEYIISQAQVQLPASTDAGIQHELYDTLREFFNDTSSWTEDIPVSVVPDVVTYQLVPVEGQIIRLLGACDQNGIRQAAIMPSLGVLLLRYPLSQDTAITATVVKNVVQPTADDFYPVAPDWILPVWGIGILDGLLGRMMNQKSKPYADAELAKYHLSRFRDAIARARTAASRANTYGTQAWIYPQDWKTSSQRGGVSVGIQNRFS
jgi:hypothetical protein